MRVLEPKELHRRQQQRARSSKQRSRRTTLTVSLIVVAFGLAAWKLMPSSISNGDNQSPSSAKEQTTNNANNAPKTKLKTFTGNEFRDLYRQVNYPNTESFSTPPEITGNTKADQRIRTLAEARGFVLTSTPIAPIVKTKEPRLAGSEDDLLQPLAFEAWKNLKAAAKKENIAISLNSAFRSPKWQRDLFISRLFAYGITAEQIAAGQGDKAVETTLNITAVPGYSRHHTGYTIDLWCEDGSSTFEGSSCDRWIKVNNYENAKVYGWVPSYPEDANLQGPEPEAWEYVWVGTDLLYE